MLITVKNISKQIGGKQIFDDVSFQLKSGQHIGFIGRNGEGKTTILDLIYGKEPVDSGEIFIKKNTTIGYVEQIPSAESSMTVYEFLEESFADLIAQGEELKQYEQKLAEGDERILKVYGNKLDAFMEAGGYEIDSNIRRVCSGLGVTRSLGKQWSSLSGGEKTRASLAKLLLKQSTLLLLDEPTNHLDISAVDWLTSYIKAYKGGVIAVSHDRYFLDEIAHGIMELDNHKIYYYHTNYTGAIKEKEDRILIEFQQYKDQKSKIKKMEQAIRQMRQWAQEADNEKMFKRAKSMQKALDRIERLDNPSSGKKVAAVQFKDAKRSGKVAALFQDVTMAFGERILFEDVNIQVNFGEKVALIGDNGAGKSTMLKLLLGDAQPSLGEVTLGSSVTYAYLSQQMEELNGEATVLEVFKEKVHVTEYDARHILATYLFYGEKVFQKIKYLSGGELMRLRLAWFVMQPVNMLIFDEPTNHLDIASREVLEEQIEKFKGTVIVVSHDRYFIDTLFDKVLWLIDGKVTTYLGNYTYAVEHKMI